MAVNPPTLLAVQGGSTVNNPQVYELQFGNTPPSTIITPVAIGGSLLGSPSQDAAYTSGGWMQNRAIEFGGELFAYHEGVIYKYDGVSTWSTSHTLTGWTTTYEPMSNPGFCVVLYQGQDTLCLIQRSGAYRVHWTQDGSTWNEDMALDQGFTDASSLSRFQASTIWRNRIAICRYAGTGAGQAQVGVTRPDPDWSGFGITGIASTAASGLIEFQGRLLHVNSFTSSTPWRLYEVFEGGSILLLQDLTTFGFNYSNDAAVRPCIFTDGSDLYVVVCEDGPANGGLHALRLTPTGGAGTTFTEAGVTGSIIPTELQNAGALANGMLGVAVYVDTVTAPATPAIYFWVRSLPPSNVSCVYHLYQWAGNALPWEIVGQGIIDRTYCLPETQYGGSQYTFQGVNKIYAQIEDFSVVSGTAANVEFRVYGTGANVSGRILHAGAGNPGGIPDTQATLIDPVSGGSMTRAGNQLNAITPDAGATLYTCRWDFGTDGFSAGESPRIVMDLF